MKELKQYLKRYSITKINKSEDKEMKKDKLNEIVDNAAMYILLFVPFVIALIVEGVKKIIKIFGVKDAK